MSIKSSLGGLALVVLAAPQAFAEAAPPVRADLVTHNEILIDAAPARIWPHIVNTDAWKKNSIRLPVGGRPGQVGERFEVVAADNPQKLAYYIENVEMIEQRRRTIRLNAPDGALIGFSMWQLTERNGKTLVQYDVYCQSILSLDTAAVSPAQIAAARKTYLETNYRRFDQEFAALKKLVEGGRP